MQGGVQDKPYIPGGNFVITRNLTTSAAGNQRFTPARLIRGIVPAALLEAYNFWQHDDGTLVGLCRGDTTGGRSYRITVKTPNGLAIVTREPEEKEANDKEETLLNLLYAPEGSELASLADMLVVQLLYLLQTTTRNKLVHTTTTLGTIRKPLALSGVVFQRQW